MLKHLLNALGIPQKAWDRWNKSQAFVFDGSNRPKAEIEVVQQQAGEATIYIYDVIGYDPWWGGISSEDFAKTLDSLTAATLHVRINSPGGYADEGNAMQAAMERLSKRGCNVIAHVDGMCASAATFLLVAANEVQAHSGSTVMVHNAWSVCVGNRHDMLDTASYLEKMDSQIAEKYARKTNRERAEIDAWMDAETYFTAQEALECGLVNLIEDMEPMDPEKPMEPMEPDDPKKDDPMNMERIRRMVDHMKRTGQ